MTKVVMVEGVSLFAQYLIQQLRQGSCEVFVLYDRTSTIQREPNVKYQAIDYMDLTHWKQVIDDETVVILNVLPEMFGDGLWHGDIKALKAVIAFFVHQVQPAQVIEAEALIPDSYSYRKRAASLQAIPLSKELSPSALLTNYARYLKQLTFKMIDVHEQSEYYGIHLRGFKRPLIAMHKVEMEGIEGIHLRLLPESILAKGVQDDGAFYFVKDKDKLYTFLLHFTPTLPWPLYRISQAIVHEWVMKGFKRYLHKRYKG